MFVRTVCMSVYVYVSMYVCMYAKEMCCVGRVEIQIET